jgi:rhamnose utilization protein RhaD (predicted bifunctional aldolase and dehydrogenase)
MIFSSHVWPVPCIVWFVTHEHLLPGLAALSHEFGGPDYVKGGGGNTSAKNETTVWVKPSGTTLSTLKPDSFLAMDRARLRALYTAEMPVEPAAREAKIQTLMAAATFPGQLGRPSVEAPLHDLLSAVFVVHNHPMLVNGLCCSRHGAVECARLFPETLWIPYIDPGFTLCSDVRRRVAAYSRARRREPFMLMLENHGIFVLGDSVDEVRGHYRHCFETLRAEYRKAGVPTELPFRKPASQKTVTTVRQELQLLLGRDAAYVTYSPGFEVARGPLSPDHIVYAKSYPYEGALTREGLQGFREQRGYWPQVVITQAGVFGLGGSQKKAELALELAQDGALVQQLAAAFGGVQFLSEAARLFIESWEVEVYRQRQIA